MLEISSHLYEVAGRMVAPLLHREYVEQIYIRRSVAAREAEFPWSDLDLGLVIGRASGADLWRLLRRFRVAKVLFPRMGECQVATAVELAEMTEMDPYRGSLDRRFAIVLAGGRPPIPLVPVTPAAAARRLVFWFEHYLPLAMRQGNVRNQMKFAREMANALGVVEGRWAEPLRSRRESPVPEELGGLPPFVQCCVMAERAQGLLRGPVPRVAEVVRRPGLMLLPEATMAPVEFPASTLVVTPAVLDLLLATQSPGLWLSHGAALSELGFAPPPRRAWRDWCYRQVSGERFRLPGFGQSEPIRQGARLAIAEAIATTLEAGEVPKSVDASPLPPSRDLKLYYLEEYDRLADRAAGLRERVRAIAADG